MRKRKVNRAWNCYIAPSSSTMDRVERERRELRKRQWAAKGCPK